MLHPLLKNTRFATLDRASLPAHLRTLLSHEKSFQPFKPTSILNIASQRNSRGPSSANVVVVSPWMDFPLGIPADMKSMLTQRGLDVTKTAFVVSKCDLHPYSQDPAHYARLLSQYLETPIDTENVTLAGHNIDSSAALLHTLSPDTPTYLMGPVSSGKSTLVRSLVRTYNPEGVSQNPNFGISNKLTHGQHPITKPRVWHIPGFQLIDTPGWVSNSDNINEFGGVFAHVTSKGRAHLFSTLKNVQPAIKTIKLTSQLKSFEINKLILVTPKGRFGPKFEITLSGDLPSRETTEIRLISNADVVRLSHKDGNPFVAWPKWKTEMVRNSKSFHLFLESVGSVHIESSAPCDWKITTPKLVATGALSQGNLAPLERV